MSDHYPRTGDKIWDEGRFRRKEGHANGTIIQVNWSDQDVLVRFTDGTCDSYCFDTLENHWDARSFGGCYMIHAEG